MRSIVAAVSVAMAVVMVGCGPVTQSPAPLEVVKINEPPLAPVAEQPVERPEFHVVRRGETLGLIALEYGLDYRMIALWNSLSDPDRIEIGQRLRLTPKGVEPEVSTIQQDKLTPEQISSDKAKEPLSSGSVTRTQVGVGGSSRQASTIEVTQPEALKLPFSDEDFERLQSQAGGVSQASLVVREQAQMGAPRNSQERNGIIWSWPVNGKLYQKYSETNKGVDIGGAMGLPVYSSARGKVIYAGSGLKGYGQMVIVKHDNEYLSTYAHNSKIIVAEGEQIERGQQIAEMGSSGAERVGLHFEIRRGSESYDPLSFLPRNP